MTEDSGYYNAQAVATVEAGGEGPTVYAATERHPHRRSVKPLEMRDDPPPPPPEASPSEVIAHWLSTEAGKKL